MDDAADIINAAARKAAPRPKAHRAERNPFREIVVVKILVPQCAKYPGANGAELWVHPTQVRAHLNQFPGSRVIEHKKFISTRGARGHNRIDPEGHRKSKDFLGGMKVIEH